MPKQTQSNALETERALHITTRIYTRCRSESRRGEVQVRLGGACSSSSSTRPSLSPYQFTHSAHSHSHLSSSALFLCLSPPLFASSFLLLLLFQCVSLSLLLPLLFLFLRLYFLFSHLSSSYSHLYSFIFLHLL